MAQSTAMDYFWALLTFGLVAIGLISMAVGQIATWRERHARPARRAIRRTRPPLPRRVMSRSAVRTEARIATNPNARVRADFPLLNGLEPRSEPFVNRPELHLNAEEMAAVARMIDHNRTAAKPSKSSTIAAGFGVSRGGSESYKRASAIYDALFGPPSPAITYRELSPEQEAMRQQLRLKRKGALN